MTVVDRLCMEADLLMALSPLYGQPDNLLTRIDAAMRVKAIALTYIDAAMTMERPRVRDDLFIVVDIVVSPVFGETLACAVRELERSLTYGAAASFVQCSDPSALGKHWYVAAGRAFGSPVARGPTVIMAYV